MRRIFLVSLLAVPSVFGVVYQNLDAFLQSQGSKAVLDFIVVGGGLAGSVVASRLSENPSYSILLVEAGPDNEGVLELIVPGYSGGTFINNTLYNWSYETVPQAALDNRTFSYSRGRVLGGSSSINSMIYGRGAIDDYDRWAKVTGDDGWSWKSLSSFIRRHEKFVPPPGGRDTSGQFDPRVHGFTGKLSVSLPWSAPSEFDKLRLQNSEALKDEFPFNIDQSSGRPLGITWQQSAITSRGERDSAATAYLNAAVRKRKNLSIVLNTYTTRILPISSSPKKLDIRQVELATRTGGVKTTLTARKEVILSGGSFGTPHVLLNSGIGDQKDLAQVNVPVIHHLPDVGKNMDDHTSIVWLAPSNLSESLWNNPFLPSESDFPEWQANRTGPLTEASGHLTMWHRIPSNATVLSQYSDPSSGSTAPHFETIVFHLNNEGMLYGSTILLTQHSRGSVKIKSNDPFIPPLIDPSWLTHPFDMEAMKHGIRSAKRFHTSPPAFAGLVGPNFIPDPDTLSDEEFSKVAKAQIMNFGHPVGTASMSARGAKGGVVEPNLKVKGVSGVRVVDASVMPFVVAGHPMGSIYLLAERAAELIVKEWR